MSIGRSWLTAAAACVGVGWLSLLLAIAATALGKLAASPGVGELFMWEISRILMGVYAVFAVWIAPIIIVIGFFATRRSGQRENSN